MTAVPVRLGDLHQVPPRGPAVPDAAGAPFAREALDPLAGTANDRSPSQERLGRIAALLRDAEQGTPARPVRLRRGRRDQRSRPAA
jgi:hypothetical protein